MARQKLLLLSRAVARVIGRRAIISISTIYGSLQILVAGVAMFSSISNVAAAAKWQQSDVAKIGETSKFFQVRGGRNSAERYESLAFLLLTNIAAATSKAYELWRW